DPACSSVLGTTPAAVVPAQAGTHNHQSFGHRWSCHIALLRRMGLRLRGDDSGESLLHIFASGNPGATCSDSPSVAMLAWTGPRACPREGGDRGDERHLHLP